MVPAAAMLQPAMACCGAAGHNACIFLSAAVCHGMSCDECILLWHATAEPQPTTYAGSSCHCTAQAEKGLMNGL